MNYLKEIKKRFTINSILITSLIFGIIIFLIDYYNIPTFLYLKYNIFIKCIILLVVVILLLEIVKNKLWNLMMIKTINYFDKILFVSLMTEICFLYNYFTMYMFYKNLVFVFIFINILLILIRMIRISNLIKKNNKDNASIISLYDLYNNVNLSNLILLEEDPIITKKKDLLNMELFANSVEDSLLQCNNKKTYIMALIGKWGCGKTSIINMLKEEFNDSDEINIGSFEPWKYDNKLSLFKGFYKYIFKVFGENYGYFNYKDLFKKYENLIFNLIEKNTNITLNGFLDNDNNDVETIKKGINDYIAFNDKKIVVIIDDIDRLDKDQILLVFKTVKTIFNFNNLIYILCYDEERINKIFERELKIDGNYINKIIQNKINMPIIENKKIKEISIASIENLLNHYKITDYDKDRFNKVMPLIFADFKDIREVIRFINTISISLKSFNILQLDIIDYITLEYIKFSDTKLYNSIYTNYNYYISEDSNYNNGYEYRYARTFNVEAKEYFDDIFKDKKNMIELLSNIFPSVEKYKNNQPLMNEGSYYFPNYDRVNSIKLRRSYNGRFFKCYFIVRHSFFTALNILINDLIKNINQGKDIKTEFDFIINEVNSSNHDLLFELLNIRFDEINKDIKSNIFDYLISNITNYEDETRFLGLNSNERAKILLATIIKQETDLEIQKKYLNRILNTDFIIYESVLYWLKPNKYENDDDNKEICSYGDKILSDKLNEIIKSKVNIFENKDYQHRYCWVFYKGLEDKAKVKKYFTSLINEETIFKIIGESISSWVGNGVRYEYNEENLELLFDKKKIDRVLSKVNYKLNDNQQKVLELYGIKGRDNNISNIDFSNL